MFIENTVEDNQDGHVDIEEHHREHGAEHSVLQHVKTSRKDRQPATTVKQNFEEEDDCQFSVKGTTFRSVPENVLQTSALSDFS